LEERKDADGECDLFCRPTKNVSQASQITTTDLTPTLSFKEGGMRGNEKTLRMMKIDVQLKNAIFTIFHQKLGEIK